MVGVPKINFYDKFLMIAFMSDGSKKYFSSLNDYNVKLAREEILTGVDYTVSKESSARIASNDLLKIKFRVQEANVMSVELYLFFDYAFEENINLQFTDMIKVTNRVKSGATNTILGYFDLLQASPYDNVNDNRLDYTFDLWETFKNTYNLAVVNTEKANKDSKYFTAYDLFSQYDSDLNLHDRGDQSRHIWF